MNPSHLVLLLLIVGRELGSASAFDYGFNQEIATNFAAYCAISYCPFNDIQAWNCPACNASLIPRLVYKAPRTECLFYVLDNSFDTTIIVFKGTDPVSWTQWASDLDFKQQEVCGSNCKVHEGFFKDFSSVKDAALKAGIESYINLPSQNKKFYVTGHSMGAAIASLFAFFARQEHHLDIIVYTLGTPRVGNQVWANAYNDLMHPKAFRIVHNADIVPHLPPKDFGFWHEGVQVFCDGQRGSNCRELANREDDGGILHISVQDHGVYFGINFFDYLSIGTQKACRFS